jgi:hypothetical protein
MLEYAVQNNICEEVAAITLPKPFCEHTSVPAVSREHEGRIAKPVRPQSIEAKRTERLSNSFQQHVAQCRDAESKNVDFGNRDRCNITL